MHGKQQLISEKLSANGPPKWQTTRGRSRRGEASKILKTRTAFRARGRLGARRLDLLRARGARGRAAREQVRGERTDAKGDRRHDLERSVPE